MKFSANDYSRLVRSLVISCSNLLGYVVNMDRKSQKHGNSIKGPLCSFEGLNPDKVREGFMSGNYGVKMDYQEVVMCSALKNSPFKDRICRVSKIIFFEVLRSATWDNVSEILSSVQQDFGAARLYYSKIIVK